MNRFDFRTGLTVICTLTLGLGAVVEWTSWISANLALPFYIAAYLSGGYAGTVESLKALRKLRLNVDILMILAAIGAAVIGEWMEGAILLWLFSLSNSLQDYALGKSRREIRSLMKLRPDQALVLRADGREELRSIESLKPGDSVVVKPGERIPVDGKVHSGETEINQAAITGESVPVGKRPGDEVFAGTLNVNGVITVTVTKLAEETTLAKIIQLVEEAQSNKAQTQRFLEHFEPRYAGGVILTVILLILLPWLFGGEPFDAIFYRAMTVLVVASPCALVISTPAAVLSAIASAARNGVLFKGGAYLEQAASIRTIAFDKTGTLTLGTPVVTDVLPVGNGAESDVVPEMLIGWAASAEKHSEHHLAAAILDKAEEMKVSLQQAENVQSAAGKGITARVGNREVKVGNEQLFDGQMAGWNGVLMEQSGILKNQAKTVVYVTVDDRPVGLIALADRIREQAPAALNELRSLGIDRILMLTGDARGVAKSIAAQLEITEYHAELLPDRKVEFIRKLSEEAPTAMVGDGVNDAPALAASHLGVAMGAAGTDVALETADVVLMGDDLTRLPYLIGLARRSRAIVWQNIVFSLAVIAVLVASVFLFALPLPLGVIGHEGSTLLVVLNGLRLLWN